MKEEDYLKIREVIEKIGEKTVNIYNAIPPKGNPGIKGAVLIMLCLAVSIPVVYNMRNNENPSGDSNISTETEATSASISERITSGDASQTDITTESTDFTQHVPVTHEISTQDVEIVVEAEDGEFAGNIKADTARGGYSGSGYVNGFAAKSTDDKLTLTVNIPVSQHYDITVTYASEVPSRNYVFFNGCIKDLIIDDSNKGSFISKTTYGIYMEAGENKISVLPSDANIDVDKFTIKNNHMVYDTKFEIGGTLSNPSASPEAQKLMSILTSSFGKTIITGQAVSNEKNLEINTIKKITGKLPAMRFGDLGGYSLAETKEIDASLDWASQGGIAGLMWHWPAPVGTPDVYSMNTDFNLANAVTDKDIALMSAEELQTMYDNGEISLECISLIKDIDKTSQQLARLRDANVPVLWRPLHEANGDWFWWSSSGPDAYKWLWQLMYRRQTEYHNLNNLIWVWCGQSAEYLVPENTYDIASIDIYRQSYDANPENFLEQYLRLYAITGKKKLIALSETGDLPDVDIMLRDRAMWSYFAAWYGNYVFDDDGNYIEEAGLKKEKLIKMYNCEASMTLDEYIALNS